MLLDLNSSFEIDNARNVDEGLKKLAEKQYDIVVSDYEMPQKNGLQFLQELNEQKKEIPFILFTGKGREEVAIKALNLGADGYFNKQGNPETVYGELAYGITKTVEHKKAIEDLVNSENKFRAYVENSPVALFVVDSEGKYVDVNDAACNLLSYSRKELLKLGIVDLLFEKDISWGLKQLSLLNETGKALFEVALKKKDGQPAFVILNAAKLPDGKLMAFCENITELKRNVELLRKSQTELTAIVTNAPIGIATSDSNMRFRSANEAFCRIVGYSEDELQKRSFRDITCPEDVEVSNKEMKELSCGNTPHFSQEKKYVRKDGSVIDGKIIVSAIRDNEGKPVLYVAELEDITQQKQAEAKLRGTLEVLELVSEGVDAGLAVIGKDYRVVWANKQLMALGVAPNKKCYETFNNLGIVCPECGVEKIFKQNLPLDVHEYRTVNSKGETIWIELRVTPLKDKNGNVTAALELAVPITRRKKTEEALKISEEQFKQLFSSMPNAVAVYEAVDGGADFVFVDFNLAAENIEKNSKKNVVGKRVTEVFPGVKSFGIFSVFQRVYQSGKPEYYPEALYKDEKEPGTWRENWVYKLPNGNIVAIYNDITERNNFELTLRASEEKFRSYVEGSPVAVFVANAEGKYEYVNDAATALLGYSREELLQMSIPQVAFSGDLWNFAKVKESGRSVGENVLRSKAGLPVYVILNSVKLSDGKLMAFCENITERKKAEVSLKESEEHFKSLAEELPNMVFIDQKDKVVYANKKCEEIMGYSREELSSSDFNFASLISPKSIQAVRLALAKTVSEKVSSPLEIVLVTKEGKILNAILNSTLIDYKGEKAVLGIVTDITELKKTENKLQETLMNAKTREKVVSAFLNSTKSILKNDEFAVVAREIFDDCKTLIGATAGYVALLSDDGAENKVLFLDAGGLNCTVDSSLPMPIRGLRETAYRTCKAVYENDFSKSDWMRLMPKGHVNLRNVMFVPLVVDGKAVGLMGLANKPSDFTERDAFLGSGFGEYAALALDNSGKMTAIQDQRKSLEVLNEKLRVVGSLTRHDVGNKLMVAKSNLYLLKKRVGDNADLVKYLNGIDFALASSDRIFEFSRLYEKIGVEKPSKENVFECFNQAAALMMNLGSVKVVNECQGLEVVADSLLKQLFYNFIDNSLKHGEKVTQIRLHYTEDANRLKLFYEDNGVGVPEANKSKLFDVGFTTGDGTGLGLYLVKKMMEVYDWTIIEEGEQGKGAKFTITIPRLSNYKKDCQNLKGVFEGGQ